MRNSNLHALTKGITSRKINEECLQTRFHLVCETLDNKSEEINNRKFTAGLARLLEDSIMFFIRQPGTIAQYVDVINQITKKLYKIKNKAAYIYGGKYSALRDLCTLYMLYEEVNTSINNSEYVFNVFSNLNLSNKEIKLNSLPDESDKKILDRLSYLGVITISELDQIVIKPTRYSELLVPKSLGQTRVSEIAISESTREIVDKSLEQTRKYEITATIKQTEMFNKSFITIRVFQDSKGSEISNYFIKKDSLIGGNES